MIWSRDKKVEFIFATLLISSIILSIIFPNFIGSESLQIILLIVQAIILVMVFLIHLIVRKVAIKINVPKTFIAKHSKVARKEILAYLRVGVVSFLIFFHLFFLNQTFDSLFLNIGLSIILFQGVIFLVLALHFAYKVLELFVDNTKMA